MNDISERIDLVPLEKLSFSKNRIRKKVNREDLALMAENVKIFGILQPLEINDHNEVVLGNRRFEAAKLASLKKVPVIKRSSNPLYEIEKQLGSDLHSKHLTILERAEAFQKLIEQKNITKYALAKYLGLSNNLVCRTIAILEANPETVRLMKEGKISQRIVATILYRLKDKTKEEYIINKIIKDKLSVTQAENLVAEINDSEILKKHFLKQVKSFRTSLKNFKEKSDITGLNTKEEKELGKELNKIKEIINK